MTVEQQQIIDSHNGIIRRQKIQLIMHSVGLAIILIGFYTTISGKK